MDNLESYLQRIVESLPYEACLLKTGEILSSNALFAESINKSEFMSFFKRGDGKEYHIPYRSTDTLYSLITLRLDEIYTFVYLTKVGTCSIVNDPLTGLLHRQCFERLSHQILAEVKAHQQSIAFLYIDLDGFKAVNDTWGHDSGDIVLKETASRISQSIRKTDFCFRMGGDEFIIILSNIKDKMHTCLLARRLIASISTPIALSGGAQAQIGASIGIVAYPADGAKLEDLVQKADTAMYKAKKLGKNNYQLYQ